jgi:hypothetical protein
LFINCSYYRLSKLVITIARRCRGAADTQTRLGSPTKVARTCGPHEGFVLMSKMDITPFRSIECSHRICLAAAPWVGTMEIPRRQFLHLVAGAAASSAASPTAQAQAYPTRPIRLVVPFPPGGAFDALARPWADKIRPLLGTVFIDNIGGGRPVLWVLPQSRARGPTATLFSSEARQFTPMRPS